MSQFKTAALDESEPQFRQFLSYLFQQSAPGIALEGVLGGQGLVTSQTATASGSVEVTAGLAVQQSSLTTGASPLINTSTATLDVFGGNPMGSLPRNDLIVFDSVTASLVVVPGTPNASPTDPTPANPSVALARLRHAASATTIPAAKIDDLRVPIYLAPSAADSGWVNVAILAGFAAEPGIAPQVRKVGKMVTGLGGWDVTGLAGNGSFNVGTIPDGYRPDRTIYLPAVGATGNQQGEFVINASGNVQIRTASGLSDTYQMPGAVWFTP